MPIEIIHGARPGDDAIGKRVDSIIAQQEAEKQRNLQASIEAARINAQMSAQRASLAMRNKEVELEAAKDAARIQLGWGGLQNEAARNQMAFANQQFATGAQAAQDRQRMILEGAKAGVVPRELANEAMFGRQGAQRASALFAEQESSDMLAHEINIRQGAAARANLAPEGQALYRDWSAKLNAVMKASKSYRPEQINQMRQRLISEFDQMDLRRFEVKVPTIEEDWKSNAIQLDDGSWVVREQTKNGNTWRSLGSPKKAGNDKPDPLDVGSYMADRSNYLKEWNAAAKRLQERKSLDSGVDAEGNPKPFSYPTDDEIQAEMDNHIRRWSGNFQVPQQGQMPPAGPPMPQPGMQPSASGQPQGDTLSANPAQGNMPPSSVGQMRVTKEMRQKIESQLPEIKRYRELGDPQIDAALNVLVGARAAMESGQIDPNNETAQKAVAQASAVLQQHPAAQAMGILTTLQQKYGNDTSKMRPEERQAVLEATRILLEIRNASAR